MEPVVLITGCGYNPIERVYTFKGKPTHNVISIDGVDHKMNIGTAAAYYLAKKGIAVILVSKNAVSLGKIKEGLIALGCDKDLIAYVAADLLTNEGVDEVIKKLPVNETIYWLQSLGMGGGTYKIPNNNIYLPFEQISPELIETETEIVPATHRMLLKLIPVFRRQIKGGQKARISIITSMSGERGYHFGATHVAAKHALVGYIEGIRRELNDEGIEIIDIRPGGIDTGMYDNPHTKSSVEEISRRTKMWDGREPIYAEPMKVAETVYHSFFDKHPQQIYRILAPHQQ